MTAHRSGDQGLVFRDLLAEFDDNIDPNAVFPWFHRKLTKNEAVELLVRGVFPSTERMIYCIVTYA